MAVMVLAMGPLLALAGAIVRKVLGSATDQLDAYAAAGSIAEEAISSMRTVASLSAEATLGHRYTEKLTLALKAGIRKGAHTGLSIGFIVLVMWSSFGLAFWWGARLIGHHTQNWWTDRPWTAGDVLTVFFSTLTGAFAVGQIGPSLSDFTAARGAALFLYDIIDRTPEIDSLSTEGQSLPANGWQPTIQFCGVGFRYPSRPDVTIFQDLHLSIEPGTTVALVGQSGSGKSTIIQLLERFYMPESGAILVDGVDLRLLNVRWWRQQLGLVAQEPVTNQCEFCFSRGQHIYKHGRAQHPDRSGVSE